MINQSEYEAFISYKQNTIDNKIAKDIQNRIEHYKIPKELQEKTGIRKFRKVFRDTTELSGTADLSPDIENALKNSDFLIVICSTHTSESVWVPLEIETFIKYHDRDHILTVLVDGDRPEDVIPELLQKENKEIICPDGTVKVEDKKLFPLSCDYRKISGKEKSKREKSREILKLISRILDCNYDDLYMREKRYRQKMIRRFAIVVFSLVSIAIMYLLYSNYKINRNYRESVRQKSLYASSLVNEYLDKGQRVSALKVGLSSTESLSEEELSLAPELIKGLEDASRVYSCGYDGHFDNIVNTQEFFADGTIRQILSDSSGKYVCCLDWNNDLYIWSVECQEFLYQKQWDYIDKIFMTRDAHVMLLMNNVVCCIHCETGEILWEQNFSAPIIHIYELSISQIGIITEHSVNIIDTTTADIYKKTELNNLLPAKLRNNSEYSDIYISLYNDNAFDKNSTKSQNNLWLLLNITASKEVFDSESFIGLFDIQNQSISLLDRHWFEVNEDYYSFPFVYITNDGNIFYTSLSDTLNESSFISRIDATEGILWKKDLGCTISLERSETNGNATLGIPDRQLCIYNDAENNTSILIAVVGSDLLFFNPKSGEELYCVTMPSNPSLTIDNEVGPLLIMPGMIGYFDYNNGITSTKFPIKEFENCLFIHKNSCYADTDEYIFADEKGVFIFQEIADNPEIAKYKKPHVAMPAVDQFIINNDYIQICSSGDGYFNVCKYRGDNFQYLWSSDISGTYDSVISDTYVEKKLYIQLYNMDYSDTKIAQIDLENGNTIVFDLVGNHGDSEKYNFKIIGGFKDSFIYSSTWYKDTEIINTIYEYNAADKSLTEHIVPFEFHVSYSGTLMQENKIFCFSNQHEIYLINTNDWQPVLLEMNFLDPDFSSNTFCCFNPKDNLYAIYTSGGSGLYIISQELSKNYVISRTSSIIAAHYNNEIIYVLFSDGILGLYKLSNGDLIETINLEEPFYSTGEKNIRMFIPSTEKLILSCSHGVFIIDLAYRTVRTKVSSAIGYDSVNEGFYLGIYNNTLNDKDPGWVKRYSATEIIDKVRQMIPPYS